MTRKYYIFIAKYLIDIKATEEQIEFIATMFQASAGNFDKAKFINFIAKKGKV